MSPSRFILSCLLAIATALPVAAEAPPTFSDKGWPRDYTVGDADLIVYQPQIEGWQNDILKARTAIGILPKGEKQPSYGSVLLIAETLTDHEKRAVTLYNIRLEEVKIPGDEATQARLQKYILALLPSNPLTISLDRLLAGLPKEDIINSNTQVTPVKTDIPNIYLRQAPALLITFDGKPIFSPIAGTELEAAVNTQWPLFSLHGKSGPYYTLSTADKWLSATSLEGPWTGTSAPSGIAKIPDGSPLAAAKKGKASTATDPAPEIIISQLPAELILIEGRPQMRPIGKLPLLQVSNTSSSLFYHTSEAQYYALISGRWIAASDLKGPWSHVPYKALPAAFSKIPESDPAGNVLISIPGTRTALEAVKEAQIPEKAPVNRKNPPTVKVEYDGAPKFEPIAETKMAYAVNTSADVIQVQNTYYCCQNGVWFISTAPVGAVWILATQLPTVIYTIPPAYPVYRCSFVRIYSVSDSYIVFGYTAGYRGVYVGSAGVVVYGTGYHYRPYVSVNAYYGYPYTYGVGYVYRPYTGGYVAGASWHNGSYNTSARWGYNSNTGNWGAGYHTSTPYASWGRGYVTDGDDWIRGGYYSNSRGAVAGFENSKGDYAVVAHSERRDATVGVFNDDLYAAKDGEVVRRTDDGWQKYDDGDWEDINRDDVNDNWNDHHNNQSQSHNNKNNNSGNNQSPNNPPSERPSQGGERPSQLPAQRPSQGGERPSTLPSGADRPTQRPTQGGERPSTLPAQRPSQGGDRPSTLPAQRPSQGGDRPSTLPAQRPTQGMERPSSSQLQQRYDRPSSNEGQRTQPSRSQNSESRSQQSFNQQRESRERGNQRESQFQNSGGSRQSAGGGGGRSGGGGGGRSGGGRR